MLTRTKAFEHANSAMNIESLIFAGLSIFLCFSLLYYYLRFQFDLVYVIPVVQYFIAYAMVLYMVFHTVRHKINFKFNKLDWLVLFFLLNNLIFIPFSFYRYGMVEGLYAIKNFLTPLLLYFVFVVFMKSERAKTIVKLVAILCTIVSTIYVSELLCIRYMPTNSGGAYKSSEGTFKYSVMLDNYALERDRGGSGVSKSWRRSDTSIFIRMPGPLGHSNATTFIIAIGVILNFAAIVFSKRRYRYIIPMFLICFWGLVWGASRTNMIGACIGMIIIAIAGIRLKNIGYRKLVYLIVLAVISLGLLMITNVIDLSSYGQIMNISQTTETFHMLFKQDALAQFFNTMANNVFYFTFGFGLPPVLPDTFSSPRYSGFPVVSDDLFYIQALSQYGIIMSLFYVIALTLVIKDTYKKHCPQDNNFGNETLFVIWAVIAVLAASFINAGHGGSVIRPQVSPAIWLLAASYSVVTRDKNAGAMRRNVNKNGKE